MDYNTDSNNNLINVPRISSQEISSKKLSKNVIINISK
jgi:hypothetical protein